MQEYAPSAQMLTMACPDLPAGAVDSTTTGIHGRRWLLQSGPARFMNAPIINTEALEAGPAAVPAAAKHPSSTSTADPQLKPRQTRGLLGADSRRHSYDRRWRQERFGRYRRYDRSTLSPLLAPVNTYSSVRRQPLPVLTGVLSSLLSPGNPRATAQSLAKAYSGGNSEAAAQAVAGAAAGEGSTQATTVAQALTETAVSHPNVAPGEGVVLSVRAVPCCC